MEVGYIKIIKSDLTKAEELSEILSNIGSKLSQSVIDVYLKEFLSYNILDENEARLVRVAVSDKSLTSVDVLLRDKVRADIFKNMLVSILK